MEKTAVGWLVEQLIPKDQHEGIMDIIDQAKEMERMDILMNAEYLLTVNYQENKKQENWELLIAFRKYLKGISDEEEEEQFWTEKTPEERKGDAYIAHMEMEMGGEG